MKILSNCFNKEMKKAFSIIELSIVIVILALLATGVIAGAQLIKASEIRAILTEKERYIAANEAFFNKFQAVPGDYDNAWNYWQGQTGCISQANCNGNGNSRIEWVSNNNNDEALKAWTHLALAEMISGNFNGSTAAGVASLDPTSNNVPLSKKSGSGWIMQFDNSGAADNAIFSNSNVLLYGIPGAVGVVNPSILPEEAYSIDVKIDDSFPNSGHVRSSGSTGTGSDDCRNNINANGIYNMGGADPSCTLRFKI